MRARLFAATLLAALGPAALADLDVVSQNGDAVTGTLNPATEVETFRVVVPAGAKLTVKAKAAKSGPSLRVRIRDAADGVVAESAGKSVALRPAALAASGEYRVEVSSDDGAATGDYSLSISWKSPTSFGGAVTIPAASKIDVPFAADAGAKLTLSVKPAKRSTATPALVQLTRPDASVDALTGTKAAAVATTSGDHVLRVADPAAGGAAIATVKVKPPKAVKRKLRVDSRSVPQDGVLVVAGLATPLGGVASVGGGPLAGTQVTVPAGAVGGPTAILIGSGTSIEAADVGLNLAGPAILLGPEGLDFVGARTATVTIPFDPAAFPHGTGGLRVFTRSASGAVTEVTGLSIDDANHVVSFPAAHFSVFQVFAPSGATEIAKLEPADVAQGDAYGFALAVSGDYAVVGAPFQDGGAADTGAAYVYQRVNGAWTELQKLTSPAPVAADFFGIAVAIQADTIAIGATGRDFTATNSGAVFVFVRSGNAFVPQQEFAPSAAVVDDAFGGTLSIDVDTLVAGSLGDDASGTDAGTAYVFVRSNGVWTEQQEILPADLAAGDQYGKDVAVSGDLAIVGAPEASPSVAQGGAAYVWRRTGSAWTLDQKMVQQKPEVKDRFGWSVAIDGTTAVASARLRRGTALFQGAAFVFVRGGGANSWTQQQEVVSLDGAGGDQFGESVALEGDLLVCGALFKTLPGLHFGGAAYVFSRTGTVWTQRARMTPSDGAPDDEFGFPVSLSSKTVFAGAYLKDSGAAADAGAAYVFGFVP